jgi:hypothetical protein
MGNKLQIRTLQEVKMKAAKYVVVWSIAICIAWQSPAGQFAITNLSIISNSVCVSWQPLTNRWIMAQSPSLTTGKFQYVGDVLPVTRATVPTTNRCAFYRIGTVSVIQLPDMNVEQAVILAIPGKLNPALEIYDIDNLAGATNLDFSYTGATNATGLGLLPGLKYLSCYGNALTSLDLSHNTNLTSLTCSYNNLTTLNISSNRNLTYVFARSNPLTNIIVWWTPPTIVPPTVNLQYSGSPVLSNP